MRKRARRVVWAGIAGAIAYAVWRAWRARMPARSSEIEWTTAPFPFPPAPRPPTASTESASAPAPDAEPWVEPGDGGACPASHPVKAKLSSGIFHVPGGANYDRTRPDRCYTDADAAEQDGLRRSKV